MNSGFYAAFSGFSSRLDALEVVANNLANASTVGYKAHHEFYRSLAASLEPNSLSPINQAVNKYGVLGGARIDMSPSTLEPTGNDTDVALEGEGFFSVQTKNGVRYTRNGTFSLNVNRQLVNAQNELVQGDTGAIQIPTGRMSISPDGTISVEGNLVAKLKVTEFAPNAQLMPEGNTNFAAPAGSGKIAANPSIRQGALESSNADPVRSAVALIDLQRSAQMMEKALSIFHNEFNKTAAQDLPRV
jgi:flagellar basal-body rod protein FlgF